MLDLEAIRKKNAGQPDGYWKTTTAALCDEVERLQRPPALAWSDAARRQGRNANDWREAESYRKRIDGAIDDLPMFAP